MKPVAAAVDEHFPANWSYHRNDEPGVFPPAVGKFPRHVLVVDDEPLIRWSVTESLSEIGFNVEQAADAAQALRAVVSAVPPFDVVVLDLRLPDMDDLSLLRTLRHVLPTAGLILMTAFSTPDIVNEASGLGAAVLDKPFELAEIRRLVIQAGSIR